MRVTGNHPAFNEPFGTQVTLHLPEGPTRAVVVREGLTEGFGPATVGLHVEGMGMAYYAVQYVTVGWPSA